VGPTKGWSKVSIPTIKKRIPKWKEVPYSDSDYEVEQDVLDIVPSGKKRTTEGKKVHANVPDTPIDNISFHHAVNDLKWKYVYQRRLALERRLGRDALECDQVMKLIDEERLRKSVGGFEK